MIDIERIDGAAIAATPAMTASRPEVRAVVEEIIAAVRTGGDAALRAYACRLDGLPAQMPLEVSRDELAAACDGVEPEFLAILYEAAANIKAYHRRQLPNGFVMTERAGVVLGQRVLPMDRVGVYVPGGTACYPSTVLMNVIPAKLAGVGEVIVTTPAKGGRIPPEVLAAAAVAGADRVLRVGGAQAVAALAYGTESIPRVDKLTGPGNAYVAEAKRQVSGIVGLDMHAGPSEVAIVADAGANPRCLAADMLAQAEHDADAASILITDSLKLAEGVQRELAAQLPLLERAEIARRSITAHGRICLAGDMAQAMALVNALAPEHLQLCLREPFALLPSVRHAGSVFLGDDTPTALGDYWAGPNHTLPTGRTARFASPLSVEDFLRRSAFTYYTPEALRADGGRVAAFAAREGLGGHARSVTIRMEDKQA